MPNTIALSSNKQDIEFTDSSGTTPFSLSGNGVDLTQNTNGEIEAASAGSAGSNNRFSVELSRVKNIEHITNAVQIIGINDISIHRQDFSSSVTTINVLVSGADLVMATN